MSDNIKILRNYFLYFLLMILVCIVGISNVFAQTYTVNYNSFKTSASDFSSQISCNNDICVVDSVTFPNTQDFNFEWGTVNSPTCRSTAVVTGSINNNKTSFGINNNDFNWLQVFLVNGTQYYNCSYSVYGDGTNFVCTAPNLSSNFKIGWKYKNNFGSELTFTSAISRKLDINCDTSAGQIIDNQTNNTQNIINNNNTNTENIINNQNQNTQEQIESQKVCENILYNNDFPVSNSVVNAFLTASGNVHSDYNFANISDYISINKNTNYNLTVNNAGSAASYCIYNSSKVLISCQNYGSNNNFTINSNEDGFIRFTYSNFNTNLYVFSGKVCENGNQVLNDSITGLNDSLNDDNSSGATSEASEFFNSFTTNTFGLTSIITAPLNLIQSLTSSACSELHLPLPYLNNKYLDLPCMTSIYQTHFGAFFTMYQTITYGIIAYWVCVRIFNQVKDFKNPEHDEIEVVDL